jgi:LSD1 subclass zinc finger protein
LVIFTKNIPIYNQIILNYLQYNSGIYEIPCCICNTTRYMVIF